MDIKLNILPVSFARPPRPQTGAVYACPSTESLGSDSPSGRAYRRGRRNVPLKNFENI